MFIRKVIQDTIVIKDANEQLMDQKTIVMDILKQRFENTCYNSCLIKEVTKIIRMGHLIFINSRQKPDAKCDVQFEVRAIQLKKNQIIHECVIKKKAEDGTIICKNDIVAIVIKDNKLLQGVREGDTIITRNKFSGYKITRQETSGRKINRAKISVHGFPFIPIFNNKGIIFEVSPFSSRFLKNLLNELKEASKCKKHKNYKYFKSMLYPCKPKTKMLYEKKFNTFDKTPIDKVFEKKISFLTFPDFIDPSDEVVLTATDIKIDNLLTPKSRDLWRKDHNFIITNKYNSNMVVGQIIVKMIEYYNELNTFCKLYEKGDSQFNIYINNKK